MVQVDRVKRVVRADDGTEEPYDRLLLATGSNPFILPVPGKDLQGVIAYRDIADTNAMIEAAARYRKAVVIGGGLLGLEAANGLMKRGMDVSVVHVMPWLMERQLDDVAGKLLQKSLEERGLKFLIGAQTQELVGGEDGRVADQVQGWQRARGRPGGDGRRHPSQHRAGQEGRPALQPRHRGARHPADGDRRPHLFGGRVRGAPRRRLRLVAPLFEQAKVAANHLAQFGIGRYTGSLTSTKLKVTGIDLFSAGQFMGSEARRS